MTRALHWTALSIALAALLPVPTSAETTLASASSDATAELTLAAPAAVPLPPSAIGVAQEAEPGNPELPPVEAPPELEARLAPKFERALKRLRNSKAGPRAATEAEIIGYGRGTIPDLLEATTTDHAGLSAGLVFCLTELVDLRDRDIVAEALHSERPVMRRFGARATGKLGTEPLVAELPPLLEDDDDGVVVEAALALATQGSDAGLGELALRYGDPELKPRVLAALPGVKGSGDHRALRMLLVIDERREREEPDVAAAERQAAVEMLHAIGDDSAINSLTRALEDSHNVVQRAAIDALRDLLEDSGPFDGKSIFQQLREVERLRDLARKPRR